MPAKIVWLLVALLILSACGASKWTQAEADYVQRLDAALNPQWDKLLADAQESAEGAERFRTLVFVEDIAALPAPPPTLAVLEVYRKKFVALCGVPLSERDAAAQAACAAAADALRLELAHIYAARGSYPTLSQP